MENEINSRKPIEIGQILRQSIALYKENFSLFIKIAILGYGLAMLNSLLALLCETANKLVALILTPIGIFILAPLGVFVLFWASMALIIAISNRYLGNEITLRECFIKTKGKYWRYVGISILYILILAVGMALFLIPGIYWATIFLLVTVIAALEETKVTGAFRVSKGLIKGSFWRVFLLGVIISGLSLPAYIIYSKLAGASQHLATILGQIYSIFYISFSTVIEVTLYHQLKTDRSLEPKNAEIS